MKGNMPQQAIESFRRALALNPLLWEAFEGLCALGAHCSELAASDVLKLIQDRSQT